MSSAVQNEDDSDGLFQSTYLFSLLQHFEENKTQFGGQINVFFVKVALYM